MSRVQDLVNSARQLAGVRSADCDRVHLFGSRARIHREGSGRMRPDATGLWEPERVVIGDQNCFSQLAETGFPFTTPRVNCQVPVSRS